MPVLVKWTKQDLIVKVLAEVSGHLGERRYLVCKPTAQPGNGIFSIACTDVAPV